MCLHSSTGVDPYSPAWCECIILVLGGINPCVLKIHASISYMEINASVGVARNNNNNNNKTTTKQYKTKQSKTKQNNNKKKDNNLTPPPPLQTRTGLDCGKSPNEREIHKKQTKKPNPKQTNKTKTKQNKKNKTKQTNKTNKQEQKTPQPPPPPPKQQQQTNRRIIPHSFQLTLYVSDGSFCLPVYVLCNEHMDCPGREDEVNCEELTCLGFYRCRASMVCLHPHHICDGMAQCPQHDDELFCNINCPHVCTCFGLAFTCTDRFPSHLHQDLRYLDARDSGLHPVHLTTNTFLVFLSLANCSITTVDNLTLPILHTLDLSDNLLHEMIFGHLANLAHLKVLRLSGNPMSRVFVGDHLATVSFPELYTLDMSGVSIDTLNLGIFNAFDNLRTLNLSHCGLRALYSDYADNNTAEATHNTSYMNLPFEGQQFLNSSTQYTLHPLMMLSVLDVRGSPLTQFPPRIFSTMRNLKEVYADTYRVCCSQVLPVAFNLRDCHSPRDLFSTCDHLIGEGFARISVPALAALSLTGNIVSFCVRVLFQRFRVNSRLDIFLTHKTVSDAWVGIYLSIISLAQALFEGNFLWEDTDWKQSNVCRFAGVVFLSAHQATVFLDFVIMAHALLMTHTVHLCCEYRSKSSHVMSLTCWALGLTLATVPLVVPLPHFYSQSSLCLPVVPGMQGSDQQLSLAISSLCALLNSCTAVGLIAYIIQTTSRNAFPLTGGQTVSDDVIIAKRLVSIILTDVVCYLAAAVVYFIALQGGNTSNTIKVVMATVVMPFNAAINPALYANSVLREQRVQSRNDRLMKMLKAKAKQAASK